MNKPFLAFASLLSFLPLLAPAQQLIHAPTFQGAAQSDIDLGGHNLNNAGTITAAALAGPLAWSSLTGTPTTLAGYGITDPVLKSSDRYADPSWLTSLSAAKLSGAFPWASLSGIPTTLTTQGNTFNGATQLVQTTPTGVLPFDVTLLGVVNSKVVIDGDSIFQGYGATSLATRFSTLFGSSSYATAHNLAVLNVAVSGSTLQTGTGNSILDNLPANVYPHRAATLGGDGGPNPIYIGDGGTNDIRGGRTAAQVIADLTTRTTTVRSYGMKCVIATISPRIDAGWTPAMEAIRVAVNIAIRTRTAPSDGVWEIDNVLVDPGNNYQSISYDGLHPNDAGHALLEKDLEKQLKYAGFQPGAGPLYFKNAPKIFDSIDFVNGGSGWFVMNEPTTQDLRIYDHTVINGSPQQAFTISGHGTGSYSTTAAGPVIAKYFQAATAAGVYSTLNGIRLSAADVYNTIYMATGSGNHAAVVSDKGRLMFFNSGRIALSPQSVTPTDDGSNQLQVYGTNGLGTISAGGITTPANYSSSVGGWRLNAGDAWNSINAAASTQAAISTGAVRMILFSSGNVSVSPASVLAVDGGANFQVYATGGTPGSVSAGAVSATSLSIASGTNAKAGTFTLSGGSATVSNTSVTADSVIMVTVKTVSGTRTGNPDIVPTAGTGFTVTGGSGDNSAYNYWIEN